MGWLEEFFCNHKWECIMEKEPIYDVDLFGLSSNYPVAYKWVYVCKKCKKVKEVRV